jgi:AcrR family transcriptional regulator
MSRKKPFTRMVSGTKAGKALASPLRLEILGQFTTPGGMSIAEVAARMGRSASGLYYHFDLLERAGILKRAGERRRGTRSEALFEPVAARIALAVSPDRPPTVADARKALSAAFRMAERDFTAALESGSFRESGPGRNLYAARMHCRLTPAVLGRLNKHLQAIESILERESRRTRVPADADQFVSLTLALLPLPGREAEE